MADTMIVLNQPSALLLDQLSISAANSGIIIKMPWKSWLLLAIIKKKKVYFHRKKQRKKENIAARLASSHLIFPARRWNLN